MILAREKSYNVQELSAYVEDNEQRLSEDQKIVYTEILRAVQSETSSLVFIDAPGGTGKTFLINLLLAKIRSTSKVALAIASSGAAATLISGGRTAHSMLKLPLDLNTNDTAVCNISKGSSKANLLKECAVIFWDEISMMHRHGLEAVDRSLKDNNNNHALMGGKVVVLAGDFRQILPVVPRGSIYDEIKACIKSSVLWPNVNVLRLKTNMRVFLNGNQCNDDKQITRSNIEGCRCEPKR